LKQLRIEDDFYCSWIIPGPQTLPVYAARRRFFCDFLLPQLDDHAFCTEHRDCSPDLPCVVCSTWSSEVWASVLPSILPSATDGSPGHGSRSNSPLPQTQPPPRGPTVAGIVTPNGLVAPVNASIPVSSQASAAAGLSLSDAVSSSHRPQDVRNGRRPIPTDVYRGRPIGTEQDRREPRLPDDDRRQPSLTDDRRQPMLSDVGRWQPRSTESYRDDYRPLSPRSLYQDDRSRPMHTDTGRAHLDYEDYRLDSRDSRRGYDMPAFLDTVDPHRLREPAYGGG